MTRGRAKIQVSGELLAMFLEASDKPGIRLKTDISNIKVLDAYKIPVGNDTDVIIEFIIEADGIKLEKIALEYSQER